MELGVIKKTEKFRRIRLMWIDVEFEVPEDGEVVIVKVGRHHEIEMRYNADPECWVPCGGKIVGKGKYPHKVEKWKRKGGLK